MVDSSKDLFIYPSLFCHSAYRMCTDFGTWKIEKQKHSQILTGRRDSETVVLNWGDFAGRLVMSGGDCSIPTGQGCHWHLLRMPEDRDAAEYPARPSTAPTAKNGLAPNVSSAKAEETLLRGPLTQPPTKLGNLSPNISDRWSSWLLGGYSQGQILTTS